MRILVIKLGALGDLVMAFQPFSEIRAHHAGAKITLLTTLGFAALMEGAPWFDRVVVDRRPAWWDLAGIAALRRELLGFDLVYDLQTSGRSSRYFRLAGRPAWSGIAAGASLRHGNPGRDGMHTIERQREQLAVAGVPAGVTADLGWLGAGDAPALPRDYALLVPGGAAHRPGKRWGVAGFGALAAGLSVPSVVVGGASEAGLAAAITARDGRTVDLTGRTSLRELASVAAGAVLAVGNDTGPMHLAAALGVPGVVLFGGESDPALTAPRGMVVVRAGDLAALSVERVAGALPGAHRFRRFSSRG